MDMSSSGDVVLSLVKGSTSLCASYCRIRANLGCGEKFAISSEKRRKVDLPNDRVEWSCATMLLQDVTDRLQLVGDRHLTCRLSTPAPEDRVPDVQITPAPPRCSCEEERRSNPGEEPDSDLPLPWLCPSFFIDPPSERIYTPAHG